MATTTHLTQVSGNEAIDLGSPSILGLVADLSTTLTGTVAGWVREVTSGE